ncbi:anti-sigma factor [Xanthomonas prunicola]|uniref:Regulator of SigK n=1 Tax=Xanthomonas prunicola TaxID=2053930 RepID=A0A9Q9MY30_9XANT|nr:anti-sigma factor [Xanthomonas prunicola]USJ01186.1 anti-sigma factor [Xanthomonas prunicola]UXA49715.1 anti-sigma factor [Xanthomonas prunicola]UXA52590.1 anti-sigma factor [Xanthomonas prunicola]UXA58012.1 anti-sigma factor [Xanthomonas prunicola]UXA60162.1 anti-sigma factor [Xanthomonas prunicola]
MSTPFPIDQEPPRDVLAGEYVLGLLSAEERLAAEQRVATDDQFAQAVLQWQELLAPLLEEIAAETPTDQVWARVRQTLGFDTPLRAVPSAVPVSSNAPAAPLWNNVRFWRWASVGGLATAAVCVLALLNVRTPSAPVQPPPSGEVVQTPVTQPQTTKPPAATGIAMTSTLATEDGRPGYVALMDADKHTITVTPLDRTATVDKVPELWLITPDGKAHSMGTFDDQRARRAQIPDQLMPMLSNDALLAVTLEPPGGAPGGVATGTVVAKGGISTLAMAP